MTANINRMKAWRESQAKLGKKSITTTVSKDTYDRLQEIRNKTDESYGDIIGRALEALSKSDTQDKITQAIPWSLQELQYLKKFMTWKQNQQDKGLETFSVGLDPSTAKYIDDIKRYGQEEYGQILERLMKASIQGGIR